MIDIRICIIYRDRHYRPILHVTFKAIKHILFLDLFSESKSARDCLRGGWKFLIREPCLYPFIPYSCQFQHLMYLMLSSFSLCRRSKLTS